MSVTGSRWAEFGSDGKPIASGNGEIVPKKKAPSRRTKSDDPGSIPPPRKQTTLEYLADRELDELRQVIDADPELRTLTLQQIADVYGVSKRTLERRVASGDLEAVRFGRELRVTLAALRRFLNKRAS